MDIGDHRSLLSDDSLVPKQLALPLSKGGDGITDPRAIANAAFLGSWALWFQPWKETMEEASAKEALIGDAKALSEHLFGLCRQIWEPISRSGVGPTTSGSELQTTSTAHNPQQMHRSESLDQSEGSGPNETAGSRVAPGFVRDLSAAYNALSKYDDGLRYPIPPFWVEESRRFAPRACQAQSSDQTTPVLYEGVATIVEKSFPRLQRYFSRRIHSEARDMLIAHVRDLAVVPGPSGGSFATCAILPATNEPAVRALSRLIQLQGPLAGAFLKDIPMNGKTFWNSEWTALSRFRFGIPLSSALSSAAKWGDEAVDKHDELSLQRHDRVRNALARSLRGIRAFCAHTECRLGTSNLYSDLTVFEGLNGATRANPLELDIHVHHVCKVETSGYFRVPSSWLNQCDNAKRHKYGGVCQALGHSFLPMGFTAWGAMSSGTTELLEKVANAAHEQGYVGEAWGTLKGDRIRAMHGLYMGVSYALNKSVAMQLDRAQTRANRAFVTSMAHSRRAFRPRRRLGRPPHTTREAAYVAPGQA